MTRHEEVVAAAVGEQERRDREAVAVAVGRAVNPDTGVPFPTASQAQLELAGELLDCLVADLVVIRDEAQRLAVLDALIEVAVRQHGRTLRSCLAELRAAADGFDEDARTLAASAVSEGPVVDAGRLGSSSRLAASAATLRTLILRGDRA